MEPAGALHGSVAARIGRLLANHRPDGTARKYGATDPLELEDVPPGFAPALDDVLA